MGRVRTIARRTFVVGSVAVAGGVAFGTYLVRRSPPNPLLDNLAEGEAAITPYVKINGDGITLITPRADKGQGAYSIQAELIAEELDVDLERVDVTPGPPAPAYFNSALANEVVPFAFNDERAMAETVRGAVNAVMKVAGIQVTGGSTTVPDGYEKLRVAGAVARETLKEAAARRSGIARSRLTTEDGHVILPDGTRISYVDLAKEASETAPVENVALRPEAEWRLLGKDVRRIDIIGKSTGTLDFGIDLWVDGMVYATVVTNPCQGGEMLDYDANEAETMPGVHQIVRVTGGVGTLADNTWTAMKAAKAVRCNWGRPAYPAEMKDHWRTLSESFTSERQECRFRDDGDVDAAHGGVEVATVEYRAPYLAHAPLEPVNAIVRYTESRIDIWTGTQIPRFIQCNVSKTTGLSVENVHVHVQMMGGSFGHRLEDDYVQRAVELAMAVPGTPVKMTYSREQDMAHEFPRQIAMAHGRGVVADRRIEAFDLDIAMPSVTASQAGRQGIFVPGPDPVIGFGAFDQPYEIPNYRVTGYRAPDLAPISSWRSVGASTNVFFHESLLDELAHAAGADPLEERLRLVGHGPSRDVLLAVKEMSGWSGSRIGNERGCGVAYSVTFGVPVAEVVEVSCTKRGVRIDNVWVAANVGRVLDPINFDNQVKGGVVFGLGHAMNCEITYREGRVEQNNFHAHAGMSMYQCPEIEVRGLETNPHVRGIGEPPVPPAAPALANAIFAATGTRIREMPFNRHIKFV